MLCVCVCVCGAGTGNDGRRGGKIERPHRSAFADFILIIFIFGGFSGRFPRNIVVDFSAGRDFNRSGIFARFLHDFHVKFE